MNLLDFLNAGVTETTRSVGVRDQAKKAALLEALEAESAQETRDLNRRNIESQIRTREMPDPETFGGVFVGKSPTGVATTFARGNQGTVRDTGVPPVVRPPASPRPQTSTGPGERTTAATRTALAEGMAQLDNIRQAREWVRTRPQSFGLKRGAALLPGMGQIGDVINQNQDPDGNEARQYVANVASLEIKDRSGAAVTISEFPRLAAFIPQVWDTPEKIKSNLDALERELTIVLEALANGVTLEELRRGGTPATARSAPPRPGATTPSTTRPTPAIDPRFRGGNP